MVADLPLRMPQAKGVIDPDPVRARARGDGDPLAEAFGLSDGMRCLHAGAGACAVFEGGGRLLSFVISGQVEIDSDNRGVLTLDPGDLFLADNGAACEGAVRVLGDCRLLQLKVGADWPDAKARPPLTLSSHQRDGQPGNFKRMYLGADGRSRFRGFDGLFQPAGTWSAFRPLIGFRFIGMADGTFIDWHPEIVNNLVVVLSGALELEVGGGGGAVEIFRAGDVCLAEDRTGEGHIDLAHGAVQVAVLIMRDEDLWA